MFILSTFIFEKRKKNVNSPVLIDHQTKDENLRDLMVWFSTLVFNRNKYIKRYLFAVLTYLMNEKA